jgi:DnaJ-class molecular chaperone
MQVKDYYHILGIPKTADAKAIKAAYRKLAKQHHPDQVGGNEAKFKDINEAYNVLSDPEKRRRYDQFGSNYQQQAGGRSSGGWAGSGAGNWQGQDIDIEAFLREMGLHNAGQGRGSARGDTGFSDFFDTLFGDMMSGATAGSSPRNPASGFSGQRASGSNRYQQTATHQQAHYQTTSPTDAELPLPLTLTEVAQGAVKKLHNPHTGQPVDVTVPAGIANGAKLRLSQQGPQVRQAGQGSPARGSLYLVVQWQAHPPYRLEGEQIQVVVPVPLDVLALGGDVTVPTLKGGSVTLSIPPETHNGAKLRLKGQGLPQPKAAKAKAGDPPTTHGDVIAVLQAQLPYPLSAEQMAWFQRYRQLRH